MAKAVLAFLLAASLTYAQEPSLDTLAGVGEVVVASAHPGVRESALREHVERRLAKAGLLLQPDTEASGRLTVEVSVVRSTSGDTRCKYTAYEVRASLAEPASLYRSPGTLAYATTWRGAGRVSGFSGEIPAASVIELVDNQINSLIREVTVARQRR